MPRLTITEVAARIGVHKSTVSRQARAHGLVGSDGKVDLAEYQRLRDTSLDPALQTAQSAPALTAPFDESRPEIAAERALKLAADRERAQIELAARKGELVSAADIDRAQEDAFQSVREVFLRGPRASADQFLEITEPAVAEARLRRFVISLLREASDILGRDESDAAGRAERRAAPGAPGSGAGAEAAA